jgi:hypothetical protein
MAQDPNTQTFHVQSPLVYSAGEVVGLGHLARVEM